MLHREVKLIIYTQLSPKRKRCHASSDVIGILGLCGIAKALTASFVGKYVKKAGIRNFNFIGCEMILLAWTSLFFCGNNYAGIITGVILIDIGMLCIQLSNQTSIFDICPSASNRVNTIFMTTYFIGGSLGTFLAGSSWQTLGWSGVVGIGVILTIISLSITLYSKKRQEYLKNWYHHRYDVHRDCSLHHCILF